MIDVNAVIAHAKQVIDIETAAVAALATRIDANFVTACELILACEGRVIVIGMGKSGHIGNKIAATLASTGTPAFFVHPGEASHGDLGMITPKDLVIMISNSGEVQEVISILPIVKRLGVKLIAMSGKPTSTLATKADVNLDISVEREACAHNLAPTSSTTATLVMGDALAVVVQSLRGFSVQDFARTHPGGSLGKRLLLFAEDLMHSGEALPLVTKDASVQETVLEMTQKALGMVGVVDAQQHLVGIFTDGDLRRALSNKIDIYQCRIDAIMGKSPVTIKADTLADEIVKMMRQFAQHGPHAINGLFVVDDDERVIGALNTHDLLKVGVI